MAWNWIPKWLAGGIGRTAGVQTEMVVPVAADVRVTPETSMQISAVWAAVTLKAKTMASLGLDFYRVTKDGRELDLTHPLAKLFRGKVNRYQTRVEFFETLGLNLYLTGNFYGLKQTLGDRLIGILPLMSSQVEVTLLPDGSVVYAYHTDGGVVVYPADRIWHIKLMGNGITGLSPLQYAKNSIGIAISGEKWATNIVGSGGKPTGILMMDKTLTDTQRAQLKDRFSGLKEGPRDSLMVLEANMKYEQVSLSPQDVQLLEARRFQVEDIARFFDVPSVLINDTSATTVWGSGIQQIITGWYKLGLRTDLERIEDSILTHLVQDESVSVEFNFEELLRTDFEARVRAGSQAVSAGLMTRNEWRRSEWLPPVEGGERATVQSQMVDLTELAGLVSQPATGDSEA